MRHIALLFLLGAPSAVLGFCANNCNGHGTCGASDICDCEEGWTFSTDCSQRDCPYGLSWITGSETDLLNSATPAYPEGKHAYTECSSKGICNRATGVCQCFNGYEGKGCRRSQCPNLCSGHGMCVLDADLKTTTHGTVEDTNVATTQYWNSRKTQQCICDGGFTGYDCSVRMCPSGDDPDTGCDDTSGSSALDVQFVQIVRENLRDGVSKAMDLDQFVTLSFTDQFNNQRTTKPISFYDSARTVQTALIGLPDQVLPDVQVYRFYPKDMSNSRDCGRRFYDSYQSTACTTDAECEVRFQRNSGAGANIGNTKFRCDNKISRCVETSKQAAECSLKTPTSTCEKYFSPDGLYELRGDVADTGATNFYWGRLVTAADVMCRAGLFPENSQRWAKSCNTDIDCARCGLFTDIRGGKCDTTKKVCVRDQSTTAKYDFNSISGTSNSACDTVVFAVKFNDRKSLSTQGIQKLLRCGFGKHTSLDGHSPKYESGKIKSCTVIHAGIPEFHLEGEGDKKVDYVLDLDTMKFKVSSTLTRSNSMIAIDTAVTKANYVQTIDPDAKATAVQLSIGDVCATPNGPDSQASTKELCAKKCYETLGCSTFMHNQVSQICRICQGTAKTTPVSPNLNEILYKTSYVAQSFQVPNDVQQRQNLIYGHAVGTVAPYAKYQQPQTCSNQGQCNFDTGVCVCDDGYSGDACNRKNDNI